MSFIDKLKDVKSGGGLTALVAGTQPSGKPTVAKNFTGAERSGYSQVSAALPGGSPSKSFSNRPAGKCEFAQVSAGALPGK